MGTMDSIFVANSQATSTQITEDILLNECVKWQPVGVLHSYKHEMSRSDDNRGGGG